MIIMKSVIFLSMRHCFLPPHTHDLLCVLGYDADA
uniref:Uncharacterized protein n=1 Tax=Rhizophora mucronata TaxID=61149 RepID=A0A2P2QT10_RHIMU